MFVKEVHNLEHAECVYQLLSASLFLAKVEDCKLLSYQTIDHIIQGLGTDVVHKHWLGSHAFLFDVLNKTITSGLLQCDGFVSDLKSDGFVPGD